MKKKLPDTKKVIELWQTGLTHEEIGIIYGVKRAAVHKAIKRYFYPHRSANYGPNLLLNYLKNHPNANYQDMIKSIGVAKGTISNYLENL